MDDLNKIVGVTYRVSRADKTAIDKVFVTDASARRFGAMNSDVLKIERQLDSGAVAVVFKRKQQISWCVKTNKLLGSATLYAKPDTMDEREVRATVHEVAAVLIRNFHLTEFPSTNGWTLRHEAASSADAKHELLEACRLLGLEVTDA